MEPVNFKQLFNSGSETWNSWREQNKKRIPDLTGLKLKDTSIESYNFSKMNFKLRFFRNSKINSIDFSFSKLKASNFEGTVIANSNFFNADLSQTNFRNAVLINCSFCTADIRSSKFNNSVLKNCSFDENTNLLDVNFENTNIINSNVEVANIRDSDIAECRFEGTNKNTLESLKKEQKERQKELLIREKEETEKRKNVFENRRNREVILQVELEKIQDLPNQVLIVISELEHKLKIKKGYLKSFQDSTDLNKFFTEDINALKSKIVLKNEELRILNSQLSEIKNELFSLREDEMYCMSNVMGFDNERYLKKKDIEAEFKERKVKLKLPEQFEKTSENEKNVNIGIYSVDKLETGSNAIVQVWIYRNNFIGIVSKLSKQFDSNDVVEKARKSLFNNVKKGDKITLILYSHEIEYSETKVLFWNGSKTCENFLINVPEELDLYRLTFSLDVKIEELPIGNIHFSLDIGNYHSLTKNNIRPIDFRLQEYEKAFISYASADRQEVLARIQGLLLTERYKIFLDVINLSGAEKWEPRLYKEIETCDVFFLFWSKASKASKWVNKEIEFALDCKKDNSFDKPRIHPIVIPPIEEPPKSLADLHYNDPITQFILADRQRNKKNVFNNISAFFRRG